MLYLIYDVETPNRSNDSICACAWMLHDGERSLDYGYQLINPQAEFDVMNTSIHHICPDDVIGSPTFDQYWESTLKALFSSAVIVAHNARFDLSVTEKALAAAGIDAPQWAYVDTLSLFRTMLPGMSCKLSSLAAMYGYAYNPHDAGEDVQALCEVLDCLKKEKGYPNYEAMFRAAMEAKEKKDSRKDSLTYDEYVAMVNRFYGEIKTKGIDLSDIHFAFHGEMQDPPIYRRDGLDKIIEALGGIFHKHACKKIDYYVCFDDTVTGTVEKARLLASNPDNHIQIIDTAAFFELLGYHTAPNREGPDEIRKRKQREREEKAAAQHQIEQARAAKKARKAELKAQKSEPKPRVPKGRSVRQIDKDGRLIAEYPTITIAAATVGTNTKSIRDVLIGKQKTAGGFRWESDDKEAQ